MTSELYVKQASPGTQRRWRWFFGLIGLVLTWNAPVEAQTGPQQISTSWTSLFDSETLKGWAKTNFGGEGEIHVKNHAIMMDYGQPLTGITYDGKHKLPRINYQIELEARRVAGSDFFCGLTFPYKDSHCTLILGGWGGQLVGFSSFDNQDASENETTDHFQFEDGRWYHILLTVKDDRLEARRDGKQIVVCRVGQRKVHTRPEVELSKPLGIAAYETQAQIRNIRMRTLPSKAQDRSGN